MASLEHLNINPGPWTDVNAATGTADGTSMAIQNVGKASLLVEVRATEPPSLNLGELYNPYEKFQAIAEAGEKVWVASNCRHPTKINIQLI